jgi:hypothetical protein
MVPYNPTRAIGKRRAIYIPTNHRQMMLILLLQAEALPFLSEIVKQSPLIGALVIAIRYFYTRQQKQESAIEAYNTRLEKYMLEDRELLLKALQNCTHVIENNTHVMHELITGTKVKA